MHAGGRRGMDNCVLNVTIVKKTTAVDSHRLICAVVEDDDSYLL